MKASQVAEAMVTNGFAYGLTGNEEVVTHSRGTSWVVRTGTGHYITVTLTEGGKNVVAVGPSSYGTVRKTRTAGPALGHLVIGRNHIPARRFSDGRVERNTKTDGTGEWVAYTGRATPKF